MTSLNALADKYEISSFMEQDPSQFLHWYDKEPYLSAATKTACTELASFIAAMLAFGNRRQFIPKIQLVLTNADKAGGNILEWLKTAGYKKSFPTGCQKFYRFYSYDDMHTFFAELADIIRVQESLGQYFKSKWEEAASTHTTTNNRATLPLLADIISEAFPKSKIVPKGRTSANKRIHMFLRWMVRTGSPVDLGLWTWYPASQLIIPLDTHVLQEAQKLGLLPPNATAGRKTAITLTKAMEQIFPGDPCRADYALFGLGVSAPSLRGASATKQSMTY